MSDTNDGRSNSNSDVADTPTPGADEAVDPKKGSELEGNVNDDIVETDDAG